MDISCPSCAEPWDTDYLCHDAIYDTDLYNTAEALCDAFHGKLDEIYRFALEQAGWKFAGAHVHMFVRCPCCKEKALLHDSSLRVETRQLLADLMGDDIDGFVSFSEDLDTMQNARFSRFSAVKAVA